MIPVPRSLHSHLKWWLEEHNVQGQPLHPLKHDQQLFTDASKEGWGANTARRTWSLPESKLYIYYLELKVVFLALKEFQDLCQNNIFLVATDNTTVVAYVNKEGGDEDGPSLCPSMENPDLVYQQTGFSQSPTHSRPAEFGSRQAIQARPDNSNRVVPPSRGLPGNMQQVAPTSDRPLCNKVQQQTSQICVTSAGPPGLRSPCTQPAMGGFGPICLPTSSHLGQSGGEVTGLPMQKNHSDCSGVAQHALVLEPSGNVQPYPTEPAQPAHTTIQSDSAQESVKPKPTCVAPGGAFLQSGASVIRWALGPPEPPPSSQYPTFYYTCFKSGSYSQVPLAATGQPLLTN